VDVPDPDGNLIAGMRPRLLLVPALTELQWTIKPLLEEWADVVSYDPPGVGSEPAPDPVELSAWRQAAARRGLEEVDRLGWTRFVVAVDAEGIPAAIRVAQARRTSVQGIAIGHAALSRSTEGERPAINKEVWSAMRAVLRTDRRAFIRHGIAQVTAGSVSEEVAARMVERFPDSDLVMRIWDWLGTEPEPIGDDLSALGLPLCPEACSASPTFAEALREFCGARKVRG
jgi:pimeloyl-ACP methyl ester carboxylesterase